MIDLGADGTARFSIRVAGKVGPVLLCALERRGVVACGRPIRTTSFDVEADADLVDIARRFDARGLEIDSVRRVGEAALTSPECDRTERRAT